VEKKNIIIDGYSIAKSLVQNESDHDGKGSDPVIKKFIDNIRAAISRYSPERALVLMPPSDVFKDAQNNAIHRIISKLGISQITVDDNTVGPTISYLTRLLAGEGQLVISSSSLAVAQCIGEGVSFHKFGEANELSLSDFKDITGISAKKIPELIAMIGDKDLNIPGIIGSGTAIDWIKKYGSIQGISDNSESLARGMRFLFTESFDKINEQLIKSRFDSNDYNAVQSEIELTSRLKIDTGALYREYVDNKLFDWLPEELREKYTPKTNFDSETTYTHFIKTESELINFKQEMEKTKSCSVYIDEGVMGGVSISIKQGESWFIPFDNKILSSGKDFAKDLLERKDIKKVSHGGRDLYLWALKNNGEINSLMSDSAILAYCIDTRESERSISDLSKKHLNMEIRGGNSIKRTPENIDIVAGINGEISDAIWQVNRNLYKSASNDGVARVVFEKIERPLIGTLARMDYEGILLDVNNLEFLKINMSSRLKYIENKINSICGGREINISSPDQVSEFLYDILKLPKLKMTEKGKASTSEEALLMLSENHEAPALIIEHRKTSKLLSSYVSSLLNKVNKDTGRVHTKMMQNVAVTSRLSSREPNLQAIPIKSQDGKKIRQSFISPENKYLLAADYSQVELRILAHLSGDFGLIAAFNRGDDIHRATAAKVFGVKHEDVTGEQRRSVKSINFGLIYGLSSHGLSKKLNVSKIEAQAYIDKYFETYPMVKTFLEKTLQDARKNGYVTTISGRKILTPNINSNSKQIRASAERSAINAPMQGSASDIIKLAMIKLESEFIKNNLDAKILLQVHDELVIEVSKQDVRKVNDMTKDIMENIIKLNVPLIVDTDIGHNWEQSHSLDKENDTEEDYLKLGA
jgi:DNA polymerase-1